MKILYRVEMYSDYHKAWNKLNTFDSLDEAQNLTKHCDKWRIIQVIEQLYEWNFISPG